MCMPEGKYTLWHHIKDNSYDRPVHLGSNHKKANMLGLSVVYIVEEDCYSFTCTLIGAQKFLLNE